MLIAASQHLKERRRCSDYLCYSNALDKGLEGWHEGHITRLYGLLALEEGPRKVTD